MSDSVHGRVKGFLDECAPVGETPEKLLTDDIELHISATGGWLYVEHLFVPEPVRRQNHARDALDAVLAFAQQADFENVHAEIRLTDDWESMPFGAELRDDPTTQLLSDCGFRDFRVERSENNPDSYAVTGTQDIERPER